MTYLDNYCFAYDREYLDVKIPASVTSIGVAVFTDSPGLTDIKVDEGNPNYSSDYNGTLYNKDKTVLIRCPGAFATDFVVPNTVKKIEASAFEGCEHLENVTFPSSVTEIGFAAFRRCISLVSVTIPKTITSINTYVFQDCSSLFYASLPSNMKTIPEGMFSGCAEMGEEIILPSGITGIGVNAFNGCIGLFGVEIPDSVTYIGDRGFGYCDNLMTANLPKSLKTIGEAAFIYCRVLESYDIPYGVTSVGKSAFYGCVGYSPKSAGAGAVKAYAFRVRIPETVTSLGTESFGYTWITGTGTAKISGFVIRGVSGSAAQSKKCRPAAA